MSNLTVSPDVDTLMQAANQAGLRTAVGCPAGSGTSSGTNTGDQTTISGNAGTATKLSTARNIDGQAFDGSAAIAVIAPGTHAATGKTTPVDADELPIVDSTASNVLKKLIWANIKATLKVYFDTLYTPASVSISASAIDWSLSQSFYKTLGTNTTFTFSNTKDGQSIVVALTNTVSNYTVTWPTVSWVGGVAPTQTVGVHTDVYTFVSINSIIYGSVVQNF